MSKTANLRVEQWDKHNDRWAIITGGSQIVYYAKDEQDAKATLAQWTAASELFDSLKALTSCPDYRHINTHEMSRAKELVEKLDKDL